MRYADDFGSIPRYARKKVKKVSKGMSGISHAPGDFFTPGTSGLGGISHQPGDFFTPGTSGMGATSDLLSNLITPDIKAAAIASAKTSATEAVKYIWTEYKVPIVIAASYILMTMILSNVANIKTLVRK